MNRDEIDAKETRANEAFRRWISSKAFSNLSHVQRQNLIQYVAGLNCEIAELEWIYGVKVKPAKESDDLPKSP